MVLQAAPLCNDRFTAVPPGPYGTAMSSHVSIRAYRPEDRAWALPLNNDAVPAVNGHDEDSWDALVGMAHAVRVAETTAGIAAFMVLMAPPASYGSLNYRWFAERYPSFLYVDRIVVAPAAQGTGIGRALYADGIETCRAMGSPVFTCEVNEEPPNPGSLAFHRRLGFEPVGRQETEGGAKRVVLLARPVA